MSCKYCREAWKPLYRIRNCYPYGDEIDTAGYCYDDCTIEAPTDECCRNCEYGKNLYQPQNYVDITVAVVGDKLMCEDKCGQYKETVKIKYCPMCGRELGAEI